MSPVYLSFAEKIPFAKGMFLSLYRPTPATRVPDAYSCHPIYSTLQGINWSYNQVGHNLIDRLQSFPEQIKVTATICKHILHDEGSASCSGEETMLLHEMGPQLKLQCWKRPVTQWPNTPKFCLGPPEISK